MNHDETLSVNHAEIPTIPFILATQLDELYSHQSKEKLPLFLVEKEEI